MKKTIFTCAAVLALAGSAQAADLAVPHTFSVGTTINPSEVNENFSTVYNATNASNILAGAIKHPGSQHVDNGDGTVTDRLTGLVWMENANCWGAMTWDDAIAKVAALNEKTVTCTGFTGSQTDWRVPDIMELKQFNDFTWPVISSLHPFSGVQARSYWSSTADAGGTSVAWVVNLNGGYVDGNFKSDTNQVWPVRGGQ